MSAKPHAVLVPYPTQGHVIPLMTLAKLLHSRGFHITFVNTEFNHRRLIRSNGPDSVRGLPSFRFETIPDGLPVPSEDQDASQDIPLLCYYTRLTCLEPLKNLILRLNSTVDVPRVTCIVADGVMSFGIKAARDLGIPEVQFWTASVCSFIGYLNYRQLIARRIVPFKNDDYLIDGTLDSPIDWIEGMPGIRMRDLPSFIRTTDPNDIMFDFMGEEAQNCLNAPCILFNTFQELEKDALKVVISYFNYTNIYTIGPLHLLAERHLQGGKDLGASLNSNLWKPDVHVFQWLESKQPDSVVYVNYGSVTTMTAKHFKEFAWGLAESQHSFLWIVRPDVVRGHSELLDDEFFEVTKNRGLVVNWCVQDQVLAHKAVGAFLTHCGWNSMMESISAGVPVICWPFFADQQPNCHYSCEKWGIGMEIDHDVKRGEVAKLVKEMMEGEKGMTMRTKAKEWKRMAEKATDVGGESHVEFEEFIKKGLLCEV